MRRSIALLFVLLGTLVPSAWSQPAPPRLVWVSPTPGGGGPFFDALRLGLRELGYVEGRNLQLQSVWSDGTPQGSAKLVAEVVASSPTVIVSQGSIGPLAAKATTTIPVVFGYSGNPVEAGMVESLARPGRNLTGISYLALDLVGKRMELLKEVLPAARRIAVVASPDHPGDSSERRSSQAAAAQLGIELQYFEIGRGKTIPEILAAIEGVGSDAVMFFPTQTVIANRSVIAEWALKRKVPTISGWATFVDGGNLVSYGPNLAEASRRLAYYVDRILKGAKPGDLPVEQPTRVELVVNQKTARAIGVNVPTTILLRADRVIE